MKRGVFILAALAAVAFFATVVPCAFAGDPAVDAANTFLKRKFSMREDYFVSPNVGGKELRVHPLETFPGSSETWPMIVWGPWHGDTKVDEIGRTRARYVGYSYFDEDVTNPYFPPDRRGQGRLDQRSWIAEPWSEENRQRYGLPINDDRFDNSSDPWLIERLRDGLWWAANCNGYDPPDEGSPLYQNPQRYVHIIVPPAEGTWGMGRMWRLEGGSVWYVSVPLGPPPVERPNLLARNLALDPNSCFPGDSVTVRAEIVNEGSQDVTTVARWIFNDQVVVEEEVWIPAGGYNVTQTQVQAPDEPGTYAVGVLANPNQDRPANERTWDDNYAEGYLTVRERQVDQGPGELTFQAVSQDRTIVRPPGTAKWTDWVTATLKPPAPRPPRGTLVSWEITSASLTYPKKHPDFTFGHPLEPVGTVRVGMKPQGHRAVVEFQEDWSMNGAPVFDVITGRMIPGPTYYTITAQYTVRYTYRYTVYYYDSEGHRRSRTVTETATASGSASGKLLVNGTGVGSYAE